MTTRKHLLKVRLCSPGSLSQLPILRECSCLEMGPTEPWAGVLGHPTCLAIELASGPCLGQEVWEVSEAAGSGQEMPVCDHCRGLGVENSCPSPWGHPCPSQTPWFKGAPGREGPLCSDCFPSESKSHCHIQLYVTPWTIKSMEFSR